MKRFSSRELILLCSPMLLIGVAGFLLSRRDPLDASRVSLRLSVTLPTSMESLDGAGAALAVYLQGPQASRWKIVTAYPRLQLETPDGAVHSSSTKFPWSYSWIRGQTVTRTVADLTRVPPGKLRYLCDAYIVPIEYPNAKPTHLSQGWPLKRTTLLPVWARTPRKPALGLSKFTITRVGNQMWKGKKRRIVEGDLDFIVQKGAGPTLDVSPYAPPHGVSCRVSPPLPSGMVSYAAPLHQAFTLELNAGRSPKVPVRVSGRANTGGCWPLAFQVEPFGFDKVRAGQIIKVKSWPVPRPIP